MAATDHLQLHGPPRSAPAGRGSPGRADVRHFLSAMFGVDQQQRSQGQHQEAEAGHRQIGHLAAVPRRFVQPAKHRRHHQPGEHQGRAGNDRIAPRQLAAAVGGQVQDHAGQKPDGHKNHRDHHHPAVDPLQPFQVRQPQPAQRWPLALQPRGLHEIEHSGGKTDHHRHGSQQEKDAVNHSPKLRSRLRGDRLSIGKQPCRDDQQQHQRQHRQSDAPAGMVNRQIK